MKVPADHFCWIELAAKGPEGEIVRSRWARLDNGPATTAWRQGFSNTDLFYSMCRFTEPDNNAVFTSDFHMLIEINRLEQARAEALRVFDLLMERMDILPEYVDLYFDGCSGCHLAVPLMVFGVSHHRGLLAIWKVLARRLNRVGVGHLDMSIYHNGCLLRMPNSINSEPGLYSIPLEYKVLRDLDLDYVLTEAQSIWEEDGLALPEECPKAVGWFRQVLQWLERKSSEI
jgi:hypothetical protein